ncbi:hypothetical protein IAR55_006626 [Kwoniella newhampshirensis]|uniref:Btz domain-containing protein n=1 Tax=Kwoniella newhampshirensis TaxID=1651941 RepID=A0AAW0YEI4_9TREE
MQMTNSVDSNPTTTTTTADAPLPALDESSASDQIVNPSASPSTQPAIVLSPSDPLPPVHSESVAPSPIPTPVATEIAKPRPKKPSRRAKARPRRRVAGSDAESDVDRASKGSLTDASSDSDTDDAEEEDEDEEPQSKPGTSSKSQNITPVGWAEALDKDQAVEVSFDGLNRAEVGSVRGAKGSKARGRGRGGAPGPARELTEEEKARIEENKKRKKDRIKAKRAELKEAKKKEKDQADNAKSEMAPTEVTQEKKEEGKKVKGKGKKKAEVPALATPAITPLAESLRELTIQDLAVQPASSQPQEAQTSENAQTTSAPPNHARPPRGNNRDAYTQRLATDPKFTPRVGGFWTHDQRLYESGPVGEGAYTGLRQMSEYWRGRGGPRGVRGGFRGRGRGFGPGPLKISLAGRQQATPFPSEQKQELTADPEEEEGDEPVLEMDRLEIALSKKDQPPQDVPVALREKKWGHEGFEAIQTERDRKIVNGVLRGGIRGRARGRGGFAPRGGHFTPPFRPVDPLTPQSTPGRTSVNIPAILSQAKPTSSPAPPSRPTQSTEMQSTQPDTESLLGDSGHAVTVKLPGSDKPVQVDVPSTAGSEAGTQEVPSIKTPEITANGQAILYSSPIPPAPPVVRQPKLQATSPSPAIQASYLNRGPSAVPVYVPHFQPSPFPTGSENGSVSSVGQFPPVPSVPSALLSGVYPETNVDSYLLSRPEQNGQFRQYQTNGAQRSFAAQQQAGFYPSPQLQPSLPHNHHQMQHSNRGSFSGHSLPQYYGQPVPMNGVNDGRGSPFSGSPNPYTMAGGQMGGYFTPARPSQKISIRAPTPGAQQAKDEQAGGGDGRGLPSFASVNSHVGGYYPQHYNPYNAATGGVQGYNTMAGGEDGVYYPMANGAVAQGYGWEGQGVGGYGYEGDYGY